MNELLELIELEAMLMDVDDEEMIRLDHSHIEDNEIEQLSQIAY